MARSLNVLVVEDERIISISICRILEKLGHRVCACVPSGEEALDVLRDTRPDLAFLDIHLEGELTGIDVGEKLDGTDGPPFVYASAYSDRETMESAGKTHPYAFLPKPIGMDSIKQICDAVAAE